MSGERATVLAIGRTIATQERYVRHLDTKRRLGDISCDLCVAPARQSANHELPRINGEEFLYSNEYFAFINNDYPYFAYDGQEVVAHHMLLPKAHIGNRAILLDKHWRDAKAEAMSELEAQTDGYYHATLTRSSSSPASSIQAHDHTHYFSFGAPIIEQHFSIADHRNDVAFWEPSTATHATGLTLPTLADRPSH